MATLNSLDFYSVQKARPLPPEGLFMPFLVGRAVIPFFVSDVVIVKCSNIECLYRYAPCLSSIFMHALATLTGRIRASLHLHLIFNMQCGPPDTPPPNKSASGQKIDESRSDRGCDAYSYGKPKGFMYPVCQYGHRVKTLRPTRFHRLVRRGINRWLVFVEKIIESRPHAAREFIDLLRADQVDDGKRETEV
jgi:hypothetical protein